ncbi:MAG: REP-associated tyrosine transposase [Opitutales bacterium]
MPTKRKDHLGTDQLRKGRRSIPEARYFITICTKDRICAFKKKDSAEIIRSKLRAFHTAGDLHLHCATVMPDHCHLLFTLGNRLTLSQIVSKLKRGIREELGQRDLWQSNFYDHKLRPAQELEPFAKYIFLNPYRKRLIPCNQTWPGWIRNKNYLPEFYAHLIEGQFPPEQWLANTPSCSELLEEVS